MDKKKRFMGLDDEHPHKTEPGKIGHTLHTPAGAEHIDSELAENMKERGFLKKRGKF